MGSEQAQDRLQRRFIAAPSPAADGTMIVTADHAGTQRVTKVSAANHHTYLYKGYQADWGIAAPF